jgi:hypothetical protein
LKAEECFGTNLTSPLISRWHFVGYVSRSFDKDFIATDIKVSFPRDEKTILCT